MKMAGMIIDVFQRNTNQNQEYSPWEQKICL